MDYLATVGFVVVAGVTTGVVRGIVGSVAGDVAGAWIGGALAGVGLVLWGQYLGWCPTPRRKEAPTP